MADREFALRLPEELVARLEAGEAEQVAGYLAEEVHRQVRRAAIEDYLAACEAAGHRRLTEEDLREFRRLVGEEAG